MSDFSQHLQVADALLAIEAELRRLDWWSPQPPTEAALASSLPFCCDALTPQQWLQFVCLPRLAQQVAEGAALPQRCGIRAYLQEALTDQSGATALLDRAGELDALLGG